VTTTAERPLVPADPPQQVPAPPRSAAVDDRPRRIRRLTFDDWASLLGAVLASLALVTVVYEHVLALSGTVGFLTCWFLVFQAMYAGLVALTNPRPVVVDRMVAATVWAAAGLVLYALGSTLWTTFHRGFPGLKHANTYTHTMAGVSPTAPLSQGGAAHALVGTLIEVGIAAAFSVPLGIATAVYLSEIGGRFARPVRTMIEAMTALPEILAGLFVYVVLVLGVGLQKSGLAVAVAMAVTMTPIVARSGEVALRIVPAGLREAGAALGATRWRTVLQVILPSAKGGLATAAILGIARGIGETAIPLICSGASSFMNTDPTDNQMNSLPLYIYTALKSGEPTQIKRAYAAAGVLLVLVLVLFALTRLLSRNRSGGSR
jgi:phosphate transport system permease protein